MGRYDTQKQKRPNLFFWLVVVAVLAIGVWFYASRPQQQQPGLEITQLTIPKVTGVERRDEAVVQDSVSDPTDADESASDEQAAEHQTVSLPALSNSDPSFREVMLSASPQLAPWLKSANLIKKFTLIANDFSQGLWIAKHMRFWKQSRPFEVELTDHGLAISDKSYRRYDALAAAIESVDAGAALSVYRKFRPLFLEAYDEFGYPPSHRLEDIFLKSAAQILAAPVLEQPVIVIRPSVYYKYADEKLEGLSPVAKQMLRMGPKNTRMIQHKVRQLVQEFGNVPE